MTPLQQAITELIEKIDDQGASPMDWPELFAVSKALEAEQAQVVAPITLNLAQCIQLLEMFGGDTDTEMTLVHGDGHSGKGIYAYYDEIPEEGAEILDPDYTHPAPPPAGEQRVPMTDDEIAACMDKAYATVQGRHLERAFARAIEAHHGIGAKP